MNMTQTEALLCYDNDEQVRMRKVINAIASGWLIYMRFNPDCSGSSFYYRDPFGDHGLPCYVIACFDSEQTRIILMGSVIDKKCFGI